MLKEECGNALFPEPGNLPEQDCLTAVGEEQINKLMAYQKRAIGGEKVILIRDFAIKNITLGIKRDLSDFKVYFRNWQSERELIDQEKIEEALSILAKGEHLFHKDGARWFRSTTFGDTKDRVVQRRDGRFTYFASDIAYHKDKFDRKDPQGRPYDRFINVWGADHHGFEARLRAAIEAMGYDQEKLHIVFVQFVTLIRDGKKVPMSTRTGNFVTLRGLYEEVGVDAAHFFFVFRKPSQHLDFDIDLAKSRNEKNPVFYVQYAHARIHSVIAKVQEQYPGTAEEKSGHLYLLKEKKKLISSAICTSIPTTWASRIVRMNPTMFWSIFMNWQQNFTVAITATKSLLTTLTCAEPEFDCLWQSHGCWGMAWISATSRHPRRCDGNHDFDARHAWQQQNQKDNGQIVRTEIPLHFCQKRPRRHDGQRLQIPEL